MRLSAYYTSITHYTFILHVVRLSCILCAYPAYYKQTEEYIRFFRIFVLLNTLEFTDKYGNILGACAFTKNYENIEKIIKNRLN